MKKSKLRKERDMDNGKKALNMFILWLVCCIAFSIGSSFYVSYQQTINNTDPTEFLSGFQLLTLGFMLVVSLPTLLMVYRFASRFGSEKLCKIVTIVLIAETIGAGMMLLCTIMALIVPDFFSELTGASVRAFP